jgi:serine/threonine-protein kinase
VAHAGSGSVRLTVEHRSSGDIAVLQPLRGETWRGKRVRLSGFLTATMSSGEAGLVAIVNNGSRYSYYFPSQERIVKSAPDWRLLSVMVDVPLDATLVSIGVWIRRGSGSVWLDDVMFGEIPRDSGTPTEPRRSPPMTRTDLNRISLTHEGALDRPSDFDFDGPANSIDPW